MLVVAGGPSLIGPSLWMSLSRIFQKILPVLLPWLIPLHSSLWCILHELIHSPGGYIVSVYWILVLRKIPSGSALCLWFWYAGCIRVNVENCSAFSCIMVLRLDVWRCSLEIELLIFGGVFYCLWYYLCSCLGVVCFVTPVVFHFWSYVPAFFSMWRLWCAVIWYIVNYYSCIRWG